MAGMSHAVRAPRIERPRQDGARPGFLWDHDVTVAEVRAALADPSDPRRSRFLARLLREERPDEVWRWVTPAEVAQELPALEHLLGRQREFWRWLIAGWQEQGLLP
jgi:hypothetical protein